MCLNDCHTHRMRACTHAHTLHTQSMEAAAKASCLKSETYRVCVLRKSIYMQDRKREKSPLSWCLPLPHWPDFHTSLSLLIYLPFLKSLLRSLSSVPSLSNSLANLVQAASRARHLCVVGNANSSTMWLCTSFKFSPFLISFPENDAPASKWLLLM